MAMDVMPQDSRLNIHPGEWYFGNEYSSLYTVLGSCVALSAWHPTLKLGGLCHYLLPTLQERERLPETQGRYGQTALAIMKKSMLRYAELTEYQLGLFGGCESFSNYDIGKKNIYFAQRWLQNENLIPDKVDVGGTSSRSLVMELASGDIHIKHYAMQAGSLPINK